MIEELNKRINIILGSGSPRRMELLQSLGLKFRVMSPKVDESYPDDLTSKEVAVYLAEKKALAFPKLEPKELLITADTIVTYEQEILGKPENEPHAIEMLEKLSGKTHSVITGVCLKTPSTSTCFTTETKVTFDNISKSDILFYVQNYKPFDKAGAYGIQEWLGLVAVKHIEGSYFNVMGLPVQQLYMKLIQIVNL